MNYKYAIGDNIIYEAEGLHEAARWGIEEIAAIIVGLAPWWTNGPNPAYLVDEKTIIGSHKIIPQNKIIRKIV